MFLYIDIETIPDQTKGALQRFIDAETENFTAPSDLTKTKAIEDLQAYGIELGDTKYMTKDAAVKAWETHLKQHLALPNAQKKHHATGLSGNYGQVVCIGFAFDNEPVLSIHSTDEKTILSMFNDALKSHIQKNHSHHAAIEFVAHNARFDLGFLFKRFVVNGIKPCVNFNQPKYSKIVHDTMMLWDADKRTSLDELCKILSIPTPKADMHGADVWQYVQDGRLQEVSDYCKRDVEATRSVFKRLNFME